MKILFMGRKEYAADLIEWTISQGNEIVAVVTDSHFGNSPTAKRAKQLDIPVISLKQAEELVESKSVDLVISYLFWQKIKEPLISRPAYGCINFHPALLPDWKGTAGYNVAILNKLTEWGATAHYVDNKIDTGNIIEVFKFNFDYRIDTAQTLERKTQLLQMDLYKKIILDVMSQGVLDSIKQSDQGCYISRREMEKLKKIDIKKDDIDLKIRAFWFPPYQGANITIHGKQYTLINDEILMQLAPKNSTFQK